MTSTRPFTSTSTSTSTNDAADKAETKKTSGDHGTTSTTAVIPQPPPSPTPPLPPPTVLISPPSEPQLPLPPPLPPPQQQQQQQLAPSIFSIPKQPRQSLEEEEPPRAKTPSSKFNTTTTTTTTTTTSRDTPTIRSFASSVSASASASASASFSASLLASASNSTSSLSPAKKVRKSIFLSSPAMKNGALHRKSHKRLASIDEGGGGGGEEGGGEGGRAQQQPDHGQQRQQQQQQQHDRLSSDELSSLWSTIGSSSIFNSHHVPRSGSGSDDRDRNGNRMTTMSKFKQDQEEQLVLPTKEMMILEAKLNSAFDQESMTTTTTSTSNTSNGDQQTTATAAATDTTTTPPSSLAGAAAGAAGAATTATTALSEKQKKEFIQEYMWKLEQERESLLAQWKAEWEAERQFLLREHAQQQEQQQQQQQRRHPFAIFQRLFQTSKSSCWEPCIEAITSMLATAEVFVANLPLTIGAVGLSWVTMGTVWFKFMEETVDFCKPVHYYSPNCVFPEFPGCFDCSGGVDDNDETPTSSLSSTQYIYQWALYFHFGCSIFAGICCSLFFCKLLVAGKLVADDLRNPTTSTPMGVVCIATECVFAGRAGMVGEAIVLITSWFHFFLAFWFLYMAVLRFGLWPDPGWFPNTVGLTYGAVKTFLYFPQVGLFFLAFAVLLFFSIFFISVVRVALCNPKIIAAPVAWIGLSAPSITMYALTLVAQPTSRDREQLLQHDADLSLHHHELLVRYYLPLQHTMMGLSLVGLASAVSALIVRWPTFSKKPFSPAHVAFCFPTLSHTNAVQAYRGAVNAFSTNLSPLFHRALFAYWVVFLVGGTVLNLYFTTLYMQRLPSWTKLDIADEEEPPSPEDTFVHEMLETTGAHEMMLHQPFMSPAVLQANEAGTLRRVRRGTQEFRIHGPYIRTRNVSALGFDPTMDLEELRKERAELLDWVARNAPRTRNRTMSNPLFLLGIGQPEPQQRGGGRQEGRGGGGGGGGERSFYGTFSRGHQRSYTTTQVLPHV